MSKEKRFVLRKLEKKAKIFDGEQVSDFTAIEIAFEKIKYFFARVYSEGKAKSTLSSLKKCMDIVEKEINHSKNYINNERQIAMLKDIIAYIELSLNLDVSFHTSLMNLYECCLEKEKVTMNDIEYKYWGRGR